MSTCPFFWNTGYAAITLSSAFRSNKLLDIIHDETEWETKNIYGFACLPEFKLRHIEWSATCVFCWNRSSQQRRRNSRKTKMKAERSNSRRRRERYREQQLWPELQSDCLRYLKRRLHIGYTRDGNGPWVKMGSSVLDRFQWVMDQDPFNLDPSKF